MRALARTEVLRALLDEGDAGAARGREILGHISLVRVDDRILNAAEPLLPHGLQSRDAIHLATELELGDDVGQLVTYDERMIVAARADGLRTTSPS